MTKASTYDDAIRERLARSTQGMTQTKIAGQTGESRVNVNRYLRGVRIPASFCAALASGIGVNGHWLLTGEGAPKKSDVSDAAQGAAADLIQLVEAMGEVTKMRLGAIAGKPHLEALRELDETVENFERLRSELDTRVGPVLDQVFRDYQAAIRTRDFEQAARQRRTAERLIRISASDQARFHFAHLVISHEHNTGRADSAIEAGYDLLRRYLGAGSSRIKEAAATAANLGISLVQAGRIADAKHILDIALAVSNGVLDETLDERIALRSLAGTVELEAGDLSRALQLLHRSYNEMPARLRDGTKEWIITARLMSGADRLADFVASKDRVNTLPKGNIGNLARNFTYFACWLEDASLLQTLATRQKEEGNETIAPDSLMHVYVTFLREVLAGAEYDPAWKQRLEESKGSWSPRGGAFARPVSLAVCAAALARHAGNPAAALAETRRAHDVLADVPAGVILNPLLLGVHHRNALQLLPEQSKERWKRDARAGARAFFDAMIQRGFGCFAGMASPGTGAAPQAL